MQACTDCGIRDQQVVLAEGTVRWDGLLQARPALLRSWDTFQGASKDSNEIICVLNRQRGLTLPRPTAAPTAAC